MNIGDTVQVLGEQTTGVVTKVKTDKWAVSRGALVTFDTPLKPEPVTVRANMLRVVEKPLMQIAEPGDVVVPAVVAESIARNLRPIKDQSFLDLTLDEAYAAVAALGKMTEPELRAKYAKLNLGMQKMNLVNRLRSAAKKAVAK